MTSRRRERRIAEEIAHELHRALGPTMPEALAENRDIVERVFGNVYDRHGVVTEPSGARILAHVPKALAKLNFKFAELNRKLDAAIIEGGPRSSDRGRRHYPIGRCIDPPNYNEMTRDAY